MMTLHHPNPGVDETPEPLEPLLAKRPCPEILRSPTGTYQKWSQLKNTEDLAAAVLLYWSMSQAHDGKNDTGPSGEMEGLTRTNRLEPSHKWTMSWIWNQGTQQVLWLLVGDDRQLTMDHERTIAS